MNQMCAVPVSLLLAKTRDIISVCVEQHYVIDRKLSAIVTRHQLRSNGSAESSSIIRVADH
jgi:hypothetical protein